jgi:hypothetical protein
LLPYYNERIRSFEDLEKDVRCLVLLGNPGIGKSDTFRKASAAIQRQNDPNQRMLFIRVSDYSDDVLINQALEDSAFRE